MPFSYILNMKSQRNAFSVCLSNRAQSCMRISDAPIVLAREFTSEYDAIRQWYSDIVSFVIVSKSLPLFQATKKFAHER